MKFLRKFYRWSLIILIPLLMGSTVKGCDLLRGLFVIFCRIADPTDSDLQFNDFAIYGQDGDFQNIFVQESGSIWHGVSSFHYPCMRELFPDDIPVNFNSSLNRIEIYNLHGIVVGDNGAILRADLGTSVNDWVLINSPTTNNLTGLCQSGTSIFAVGDAGTVIKSTDLGLTWSLLNFPYNVDLNDCNSPSDGEVICVGPSFTAYRTTDYGVTWGQIFFGDVFLTSIKSERGSGFQRVYYFDNNISYIVGSGVAFRTNNNWNTFEFQDPGTTEQLNDVFFVAPDTGVIIGNNGTARFTSDGGQNWFEDPDVTTALEGTTLKRIKKQADDDFGYIVGEGGLSVAFARDSTAFINSVHEEQQVVIEYSLSQNYPNPFNPSTKIKFEIPSASLVTLKVYDLLGNEITTLVDEEKTAGVYEVKFKAEELTSGIYFYKLQAEGFTQTKKLVFLK
jgi:photosystem II stability/assembly factor-like uncharacterized protein